MPDLAQKIRSVVTSLTNMRFRLSASIIMFINSQGNVYPCDFTMLLFGNILERPIHEIWDETSKHFCTPGPACYANISNDVIFSKKKAEWPLKKQVALEILNESPSYNEEKLPEFYKRMGFPVSKN